MKRVSSQSGQMTLEMILITLSLIAIATSVSSYVRKNTMLATLVEGPQSFVEGMVQNGVWLTTDKGMTQHPNLKTRHASLRPIEGQ